MKKLTQLMGIATVVLAAGLANAEAPSLKKPEKTSTTVSFNRASAQTLEGAQDLYVKLRSAAESVCSQVDAPIGMKTREHRDCVDSALDEAVHETNIPLVSLLHGDRSVVMARLAR